MLELYPFRAQTLLATLGEVFTALPSLTYQPQAKNHATGRFSISNREALRLRHSHTQATVHKSRSGGYPGCWRVDPADAVDYASKAND